jgi:hypothetical protein
MMCLLRRRHILALGVKEYLLSIRCTYIIQLIEPRGVEDVQPDSIAL